MIDINKLKNISALSLLNKYEGKNPYLKKLRKDYLQKGKVNLTDTQASYVSDFHDKEPHLINRAISITEYFGLELQKQNNLSFVPQRILFQFILADTGKAYHIYGKLKRNQEKSQMYWVPKTQVLEDPYWEEPTLEINLDKYVKIDTKNRKPYRHQETGIKFLLTRDGCILADEMGLGKTYMSTLAAIESGVKKVLVVCPSSMKITWQREIECFGEETSIIQGKVWNPAKFTIINFDILKNFHTTKDKRTQENLEKGDIFHNELIDEKFDLVIVDEAHGLKNHKSVRGKIMTEVCTIFGNPKVWLLTGTPVANRPMDFYNLLRLVKSPLVENFQFYVKRYCDGKTFWKKFKNGKKKKIWLTNGASNLDELAVKTRNLILRRKKSEVLDMPEKTISTIYHELTPSQKIEYNGIWEDYLLERKKKKKRGTVERDLVELILLRQFIAKQTIEKTIELVENALEEDQKVIVFTNFNEELELIREHFGNKCVIHNGSMDDKSKQVSVDRFQEDENIRIFIGNIKSAGVGITLTAATTVIFNSLDWVPGNILQAIDRCYRIGQVNNVSVYFNIFNETVDQRVWESLFSKTDVIEAILGGSKENIFDNLDDENFIAELDTILYGEE